MKKKILVVDSSSGLIAGAQKVTLNVLNTLEEDGSQLRLLVRSKFSMVRTEYSTFTHDFLYGEYLLSRTISVGSTTQNSFFKKLYTALLLIMSIAIVNTQVFFSLLKNKTTHVYAIDPRSIILCGLACKLFRVKLVWHLHGDLRFNKFFKNIFYNISDLVLVPSQAIADSLSIKNKVIVLYNGFEFKDCLKTHLDVVKTSLTSHKLIFVGSIVPHKGLHNIIYAISRLKKKTDFQLTIVGDSVGEIGHEYKKYLEGYVLDEGLSDNVKFIGWSSSIPELLICSDLLIFPSIKSEEFILNNKRLLLESSEALPTVLIEAKSYGIPVIANNVVGVDEIIKNNLDGYVIDDMKVGDIVEYLEAFDDRIITLSPNYKDARYTFSLETMKVRLKEVFC